MRIDEGQLYKNSALSAHWFEKGLLPQMPDFKTANYSEPSRILYQSGVKFFLVQEGSGKLIVNAKHFRIEAGFCGLLYYCDFHRFIPDDNIRLQVTQIICSYETFVFASILPGNSLTVLQLSSRTILMKIKALKELLRINAIVSDLEKHTSNDLERTYFQLFEIFARLNSLWSSDVLAEKISPLEWE